VRLSVVIPAYQEAPLIADAIENARGFADEVIVADAGSPDGTGAIAAASGVPVVQAAKGRGPQLLAGAAAATGDVLLFLHADARLPARARDAVLGAMRDDGVVGGGFYIRFLPQSWFTRALEPGNDVRRRITRSYYGDTAIFARAEVYRRLGGHKPWKVMHDYEFSRRLEAAGPCVYVEDPCIWASARRFEGREIRTLLTWVSVQGLYRLGVPPRLLSPLYPDVRGGNPERFIAMARERTGQAPAEY
jgi:glycosyltransferase involved in cell wall biosynthesis